MTLPTAQEREKTLIPLNQLKVGGNFIFNRGGKKELGKVFTPPKTVCFMVSKLGKLEDKTILEPCAGQGVFIRGMIKRGARPNRIIAFDIDLEFKEVYRELGVAFGIYDFLLNETEKLFLPRVDCVIGNPPYLSRHSAYIQKNKETLKEKFKEIGVFDTYTLFIYKGLLTLKEGGILCFITSDSFLTVEYHKKLREFILKNTKIKEIILAPKNLFSSQGVSVSPTIIVLEKCLDEKERGKNIVSYVDRLGSEDEYSLPKHVVKIPQKLFLKIENYPLSINVNDYTVNLLNYPTKLTEVLRGHIGLHTHNNKKYIAAIESTSLALKFQKNGRKIIARSFVESDRWKFYLKRGGKEKYWREINEAIDWSEKAIRNYEIPKGNLFGKEGIVISGVSKGLAARYMPAGCWWDTNKAMGFIPCDRDVSIYYLLGLLNSKLYNFLIKGILNMTNCVQIDNIKLLPFIYPSPKIKQGVQLLVSNIIKELKRNPDYSYTEEQNQIDEFIFGLYSTPRELREYIKQKF